MGDPATDFAALMSGAAAAADDGPADAPYGYTRDRVSGELRPKKVPGRPRAQPPSVEELKAARQDAGEGLADVPGAAGSPPAEDRPPDEKRRRGRHRAPETASTPSGEGDNSYVPGRIARGMNRLYRRAGKIVKAFDTVTGEALIEVTRKDDDGDGEDLTVGDAWEELARTNPRVRRFLHRLISGGAWGQLAAAHAPIFLAILMKPAVLAHIPFARLIEALADRDEDQDHEQPGETPAQSPFAMPDGLQPADMQQMIWLAETFARGFDRRGATLAPPKFQEAA